MPTCPDCGTRLPEVANFCWACGKSLQEPDLPSEHPSIPDDGIRELDDGIRPLDDGIRQLMVFLAGKKSLEVTYLLWLFFGFLGAHRFYLGRMAAGFLMLLLLVLGASGIVVWYYPERLTDTVVEVWVASGIAALVMGVLWLLLDLFLIPDWVRTHNRKLMDRGVDQTPD